MFSITMKIIGAIGLLMISYGILLREAKKRNIIFCFGGLGLLIYSIYIKDIIFVILQLLFILSSVYALYNGSKKEDEEKIASADYNNNV